MSLPISPIYMQGQKSTRFTILNMIHTHIYLHMYWTLQGYFACVDSITTLNWLKCARKHMMPICLAHIQPLCAVRVIASVCTTLSYLCKSTIIFVLMPQHHLRLIFLSTAATHKQGRHFWGHCHRGNTWIARLTWKNIWRIWHPLLISSYPTLSNCIWSTK